MKKKLISGLFLMLWMALLIAAMVYPQGIFPVLAASGVWVACLLTWAVIPVALAALIKNGPLWQELRASLLKTITRKEKRIYQLGDAIADCRKSRLDGVGYYPGLLSTDRYCLLDHP
ncbi:membrane protein [Escherichia coli]|nr:membrane protein [Escherichia coli]